MSKYYVYTLAYPEEMGGAVFYVGEGTKYRLSVHEWEAQRGYRSDKHEVIRSIWAAGYAIAQSIVFRSDSKEEVVRYEQQLILSYGLYNLVNKVVAQNSMNLSGQYHVKITFKTSSIYRKFMKKIQQAQIEANQTARSETISYWREFGFDVDAMRRAGNERDIITELWQNVKRIL